jgi:hypothetical protein
MPTTEEVNQYGLKVGEFIRMNPGGPVYKVDAVTSSRAYCIPMKKTTVKVRTLDPDTGLATNREFDKPDDGGTSISVISLVERVTEEAALASVGPTTKQRLEKESNVMATASAIPVAGKSAGEREKARKLANARSRASKTAGIPGSGSKGKARLAAAKKAPKTVRKCFCGCGEETMSYFVPGHDARFNGWLKQIEKGKATAEKLLTKTQRDALGPWKKRGDGFAPTKNYKGEPYKAH